MHYMEVKHVKYQILVSTPWRCVNADFSKMLDTILLLIPPVERLPDLVMDTINDLLKTIPVWVYTVKMEQDEAGMEWEDVEWGHLQLQHALLLQAIICHTHIHIHTQIAVWMLLGISAWLGWV